MGMTLEDTRIMNEVKRRTSIGKHRVFHTKTIFGVNKMTEVKKVIEMEAEWFARTNPGWTFTNIEVESKGTNSVTYKMIFEKDGSTH